jgi:molybdate transport system substrate-binding protein
MNPLRAAGRALVAFALPILLAVPAPVRAADPVTVLAAASLADALTGIGDLYRGKTGEALRFSFAASSQAARQIEAGAPAGIFASANARWMDYLAGRGAIAPGTRVDLLRNGLVLVAPLEAANCTPRLDDPASIVACLGDHGRLAVGDPDHVPAGIYARQALTALGVWPDLEARLARADNVRAALALVARGEAPLGIVYATDAAIVAGVRVVATFPESSHAPIVYPFAIVAGAESDPAVRRAFAFLTDPQALTVFERFGFAANPAR